MTAGQTRSFVRALVVTAIAVAFVLANNPILLKAPVPTGLLVGAMLLFFPLVWAKRPRRRKSVAMWPGF